MSELLQKLNAETADERLSALKELMALHKNKILPLPQMSDNVNNHIHTTYSFSPYSPTMAAYLAWKNGLATAGIMDHDSVGGLTEFIEAGKIIGIAVTVGFELRTCFKNTPFAGKRINNPDQKSVAYLAMHGIPHDKINAAEAFLEPFREERNVRNRLMTARLNAYTKSPELCIDFESDVLPISQYENGGSITERHILYALTEKMMRLKTPGADMVDFLRAKFKIKLRGSNLEKLKKGDDPWYQYYLLGVLKGHMVENFYIDAVLELPDYKAFIALAEEIGAVSAYAYLGDVGDSVTGDKKTQTFEDAYLDELVPFLKAEGFRAITYMPTRNTKAQLKRLMNLCEKHEIFQICGEDINSPFQPFICEALKKKEYSHLITAAWALIGHENTPKGMFSSSAVKSYPMLKDRINHFADLGGKL